MSKTGIFVLIIAIFAVHSFKLESPCEADICADVCDVALLPNSRCNGWSCDCSSGRKCSDMTERSCAVTCDHKRLVGVCDENDYCICKAKLKFFPREDCAEGCREAFGKWCEADGGVMVPIGCLAYGPQETCGCQCIHPCINCINQQFTTIHKHLLNKIKYTNTTL